MKPKSFKQEVPRKLKDLGIAIKDVQEGRLGKKSKNKYLKKPDGKTWKLIYYTLNLFKEFFNDWKEWTEKGLHFCFNPRLKQIQIIWSLCWLLMFQLAYLLDAIIFEMPSILEFKTISQVWINLVSKFFQHFRSHIWSELIHHSIIWSCTLFQILGSAENKLTSICH